MFFRFIACSWFIARSTSLSHVRWADYMLVKFIIDSQTFLLMFLHKSLISDKVESIRVYCSECVSFEVIFLSRKTRTNASKILFLLWIIESTDSFDSMCSIRFVMKRKFCIEECQDQYIHLDLAASMRFHEISSKSIVVQDRNLVTRNLKRNCSNSIKTLLRIDFSIAINHARLLATTLDAVVCRARREEFVAAIAYLLIETSNMRTWLKMTKSFTCCSSSESTSSESTSFLWNSTKSRCNSCLSHSQFWFWLNVC